jgi:hypothetical protein
MTLLPSEFSRSRQSSDEWQEGVRWENRVKKLESKIENLERLMWWTILGYITGIIAMAAVLLFHH